MGHFPLRASLLTLACLALSACGETAAVPPGGDAAAASDGAGLDASTDAGATDGVAGDAARADAPAPDAGGDVAPSEDVCAADPSGLVCLYDQWDRVRESCDSDLSALFLEGVHRRHGDLPAWYQGRALFVTYGESAAIAGDFNDWSTTTAWTEALCGSDVYVAELAIPSGYYAYKLVRGGVWLLDPENWAFAYDDFAGNADGKNSVLNTYDSGRGHLVRPDFDVCSDVLGNCRPFTTYLPRGYGDPSNAARTYPVLFMHDGQNIFDDHDCCFGHTGWEVNVTLDAEIAAGSVRDVVVVGFDHAGDLRGDEYAYSTADGGSQELFMQFQVEQVQPTALQTWRLDARQVYVAGSSFGGLVSVMLAFTYPDTYVGAASLSGAFWPGVDTGHSVFEAVEARGRVPVGLYLDHGGTVADGGDGIAENLQLRDLLVGLGYAREDAPDCTFSRSTLCYYHDVGATHDELAWKARAALFLRYFFAP